MADLKLDCMARPDPELIEPRAFVFAVLWYSFCWRAAAADCRRFNRLVDELVEPSIGAKTVCTWLEKKMAAAAGSDCISAAN